METDAVLIEPWTFRSSLVLELWWKPHLAFGVALRGCGVKSASQFAFCLGINLYNVLFMLGVRL